MTSPSPQPRPEHHYHFITGRLAETALRQQVVALEKPFGFTTSIGVAPITVAALITSKWLQRHWEIPDTATHVVLPGYCETGIEILQAISHANVLVGPRDCRDLMAWFGGQTTPIDLSNHSIEIIAEINHVPRMSMRDVLATAQSLRADGADRIDLGCDPSHRCLAIGDYVKALVDQDLLVSIDTFDPSEAFDAVQAGATLVLSVNQSNRERAVDWGCEVVAVPDAPDDPAGLDATLDWLTTKGVPFRIDPILEPIGSGFFTSLLRYHEARLRYPDAAIMMGIGNLTELTDVDSAGVNFILLGICQELAVTSVLTTQVIHWARSSVAECEIARRMVHYSISKQVPPKRLSDKLVMLRDAKWQPHTPDAIRALRAGIKDNNYRLLTDEKMLHLLSAGVHLTGEDPFELFERLLKLPQSDNVDASHAFYLGFEMAKASIALTLGKQYEQDQSLRWGHLTVEEDPHRLARTSRHRKNT